MLLLFRLDAFHMPMSLGVQYIQFAADRKHVADRHTQNQVSQTNRENVGVRRMQCVCCDTPGLSQALFHLLHPPKEKSIPPY